MAIKKILEVTTKGYKVNCTKCGNRLFIDDLNKDTKISIESGGGVIIKFKCPICNQNKRYDPKEFTEIYDYELEEDSEEEA